MSKKIIRLRRKGVRYSPIYDIVVTYQKKRAKGPFIEKLGFFNPKPPKILFINNQKMGF
jgi:ribosomal protein S16